MTWIDDIGKDLSDISNQIESLYSADHASITDRKKRQLRLLIEVIRRIAYRVDDIKHAS